MRIWVTARIYPCVDWSPVSWSSFHLYHASITLPLISFEAWTLGETRGTPWTGHQPIAGPHRDRQPFTLKLIPRAIWSPQSTWWAWFRSVGENQSAWENPSIDGEMQPSFCETGALFAALPCHPHLNQSRLIWNYCEIWKLSSHRLSLYPLNIYEYSSKHKYSGPPRCNGFSLVPSPTLAEDFKDIHWTCWIILLTGIQTCKQTKHMSLAKV